MGPHDAVALQDGASNAVNSAEPSADVPVAWLIVLIGLLTMIGTMLIFVLARWVRRVASRGGTGAPAQPAAGDHPDPWTEAGRRAQLEEEPEGDDEEDEPGDDRPRS